MTGSGESEEVNKSDHDDKQNRLELHRGGGGNKYLQNYIRCLKTKSKTDLFPFWTMLLHLTEPY